MGAIKRKWFETNKGIVFYQSGLVHILTYSEYSTSKFYVYLLDYTFDMRFRFFRSILVSQKAFLTKNPKKINHTEVEVQLYESIIDS